MQQLKALFYALATFLAASSISVGTGGALLIQLPPLSALITHVDLYGAGLLVLVEIFSRVTASATNVAPTAFLIRFLDSIITNRSTDGGRFITQSISNRAASL